MLLCGKALFLMFYALSRDNLIENCKYFGTCQLRWSSRRPPRVSASSGPSRSWSLSAPLCSVFQNHPCQRPESQSHSQIHTLRILWTSWSFQQTLNASLRPFSRSSGPPNLHPTALASLDISMSTLQWLQSWDCIFLFNYIFCVVLPALGAEFFFQFFDLVFRRILAKGSVQVRMKFKSPFPCWWFLFGKIKLLPTWGHLRAYLCSHASRLCLRQTSQTPSTLPPSAPPGCWCLILIGNGFQLTFRLRALEAVLTISSLFFATSFVNEATRPVPWSPPWGNQHWGDHNQRCDICPFYNFHSFYNFHFTNVLRRPSFL